MATKVWYRGRVDFDFSLVLILVWVMVLFVFDFEVLHNNNQHNFEAYCALMMFEPMLTV